MKRILLLILSVTTMLFAGALATDVSVYAARCFIDFGKFENGVATDETQIVRVPNDCTYEGWSGAGYPVSGLPNPFPSGDGTCIYFPTTGNGQVVSCGDARFANAPSINDVTTVDARDGVVGSDNEARRFCEEELGGVTGPYNGSSGQGSDYCFIAKSTVAECSRGLRAEETCNIVPLSSMVGQKEADLKSTLTPTSSITTDSAELDSWLQRAIDLLSLIIGLVVVVSIIFAGIQYMTAGGNSAQVAAAKNRIMLSILSLILFGFTYTLLQWLVPGGIF